MTAFLLVGLGGALGAMARFGLSRLLPGPLGTFAANVSGALLLGLLMGLIAARSAPEEARLLLGVGLLGGYTTFSAFSLDAVALATAGAWGALLAYVAGSVLLSILALAGGLWLARTLAA